MNWMLIRLGRAAALGLLGLTSHRREIGCGMAAGLALVAVLLAGGDRKAPTTPAGPAAQVGVLTVQPQPVVRTTELPGMKDRRLFSLSREWLTIPMPQSLMLRADEVIE